MKLEIEAEKFVFLKVLAPAWLRNAVAGAGRSIRASYIKASNSSARKRAGMAVMALTSAAVIFIPATAAAYSKAQKKVFQRSIIDYRRMLNPRFKKIKRTRTKYIIVHTSEAELKTTLKIVTRGKQYKGRWLTRGGHTHYVIARDGRTFRVLGKRFRADHAGRSMWNGRTDISSVSIGIELVGHHSRMITAKQNRSVGVLIDILQKVYRLNDLAVLTHSQVAYGKPNRWIAKKHRGRKHCAANFNRSKADLGPGWSFDPDVRAKRLRADPHLASIYYGKPGNTGRKSNGNIISRHKTAWSIAGRDYNLPTTLYQFPNGRILSGDQVERHVGWNRIAPGTVVMLKK